MREQLKTEVRAKSEYTCDICGAKKIDSCVRPSEWIILTIDYTVKGALVIDNIHICPACISPDFLQYSRPGLRVQLAKAIKDVVMNNPVEAMKLFRYMGDGTFKEVEGMRELEIGTKRFTRVVAADKPMEGGVCHEYYIGRADRPDHELAGEFGHVQFQNGPLKENEVNGCHQEDLIAICIDRLRGFQSGQFVCRENALALTKLEEALHWLKHRTADREQRGVEGTNEP